MGEVIGTGKVVLTAVMPQDRDEMLPDRWLDDDTGHWISVWGVAGWARLEATVTHVPLDVVAMVTGLPLVDLSIEWDDHIVRGTE